MTALKRFFVVENMLPAVPRSAIVEGTDILDAVHRYEAARRVMCVAFARPARPDETTTDLHEVKPNEESKQ